LLDLEHFTGFDEIQLFDIRGIQIGEWQDAPAKFTIPTDKYPAGSYFFHIRLEDNELIFYQRINHP
jgi:hypothetical protein